MPIGGFLWNYILTTIFDNSGEAEVIFFSSLKIWLDSVAVSVESDNWNPSLLAPCFHLEVNST